MFLAIPMASSVREVLLKTSAPSGKRQPTRCRASAPESAIRERMPLASSANAAAAMRSSEASSPNSSCAAPPLVAWGASVIFHLREAPVGERYGHRSLADRRGGPLDRAAAHVACGEHAGHVGLQRHWFA